MSEKNEPDRCCKSCDRNLPAECFQVARWHKGKPIRRGVCTDCRRESMRVLEPKRARIPWTPWELQTLREHWPTGGYEVVSKLIPLRSKFALQKMASDLGVNRDYITADRGTRRLTLHTKQQIEACRLFNSWRVAANDGPLRPAA